MLPLATQNSLLVVWLVPFQVGFPPTLFQALAGRTACQQCAADFAARFLYNFNSACQEHPNLSSIVKKDADIRIANSSRPDNKFAYQANRAFIIGGIKYLLPRMLCGSFHKWMVTDLFLSAAKVKSQIQPGRKYKRCKKKDNLWTHFYHRKTVL